MPGDRQKSLIGKVVGGIKIKMDRITNGKYQRHFCASRQIEPSHCRRLVMIECTYDVPIGRNEFNDIITNWFDPHHGTLPIELYKKMASIGVMKKHSDGKLTSFRLFVLFGEDIPIEQCMKRGDPDILPVVLKMLFPLSRVLTAKREIVTCDVSRDVFDSHVTLHETRCWKGIWYKENGEPEPAQAVGTTSMLEWKAFRKNICWRPKYGYGSY
ncbi:hypothetical protein SGCOL_003165 [Colletotrichum sp. CLE4]